MSAGRERLRSRERETLDLVTSALWQNCSFHCTCVMYFHQLLNYCWFYATECSTPHRYQMAHFGYYSTIVGTVRKRGV